MNVVIMIAVLSVGQGRPLWSILVASAFGFLAFLAGSSAQTDVFNWMLALSGLSSIFTWGSICLAHIRFRKGWRVQGHTLDELAWRSQPGIIGSWVGFVLNCLVLVAQFWTGIWPIGYDELTTGEQAENFFEGGYVQNSLVYI